MTFGDDVSRGAGKVAVRAIFDAYAEAGGDFSTRRMSGRCHHSAECGGRLQTSIPA